MLAHGARSTFAGAMLQYPASDARQATALREAKVLVANQTHQAQATRAPVLFLLQRVPRPRRSSARSRGLPTASTTRGTKPRSATHRPEPERATPHEAAHAAEASRG